ncbi:hypothetical protein DU500_01260 [Haloplanus rubicundus]|uniref:Uncharacterized protein n=1 Tax=Haloplanus rubicundus TaxID=1547898 RepID=A0A345DYY9_9EURY|nr:hypothetical protein [Haloplanus rubicundus]AXG05161.1 hypothetical protein DU500_01260 [Haloplanus rubicundus]
MVERESHGTSTLEFESVPARRDLQLSKRFETPEGDEIRAIVTVRDNVILTSAGESDGVLDDVVVVGDGDTVTTAEKGFLGGLWNKAKSAVKGLIGVIGGGGGGGGGGGCKPEATTTVKLDKKGQVREITSTAGCKQ